MFPSISVIIATYNGEEFITQQLWSIANQTRSPTEIIISDDGSTDSTVRLLRSFREHTNIPVTIIENNGGPRGVAANFEEGLKLATSELVVFSDQDDVWIENKLDVFGAEFGPETGFVYSDAKIVGADLSVQSASLFEKLRFNPAVFNSLSTKAQLLVLLRSPDLIYGMSLGVRRDIAHRLLPMASKSYVLTHDSWLSIGAVALGFRGKALSQALVLYRSHPDQLAGAPDNSASFLRKSLISLKKPRRHDPELPQALAALSEIVQNGQSRAVGNEVFSGHALIATAALHLSRRLIAYEAGAARLAFLTLVELATGRYHIVGGGFKTALRDLLR